MADDVHMSLDVKIVLTEPRQAQRCRIHDQKGETRHLSKKTAVPILCFAGKILAYET